MPAVATSWARPAGNLLALAATVIAVMLALAAVGPMLIGWEPMTVVSGSMRPALSPGDVVVVRSVSPGEISRGDIVTFRDPGRGGRLVTHRVRDIHPAGGGTTFTTRGDANTGAERWSVEANGRVGLVVYRVPAVGHAGRWLATPVGRFLLVLVPALVLLVFALRTIWRHDDA